MGGALCARTHVRLGELTPDDVEVGLYLGPVDSEGELTEGVATQMQPAGRDALGRWIFEASGVACSRSGLHGFTVRVLPYHPDLTVPFLPGLICWAAND